MQKKTGGRWDWNQGLEAVEFLGGLSPWVRLLLPRATTKGILTRGQDLKTLRMLRRLLTPLGLSGPRLSFPL